MTLRSRCFPLNGNAVDVTLWSHAHSFGMNAIGVLGNWDAKTLLAISKTSMDQMIPHGDTERLWKLINDVIDLEKIRLSKFR